MDFTRLNILKIVDKVVYIKKTLDKVIEFNDYAKKEMTSISDKVDEINNTVMKENKELLKEIEKLKLEITKKDTKIAKASKK